MLNNLLYGSKMYNCVFPINYSYQSSCVRENNEMPWSYLPNDSVYTTDNGNLYSKQWTVSLGAEDMLQRVSKFRNTSMIMMLCIVQNLILQ